MWMIGYRPVERWRWHEDGTDDGEMDVWGVAEG